MLEEKFFAIFKSYINDLVDVAVKNTLKEYGFDEKKDNADKKQQEEQEKKYQEQEKRYQEKQKQKQQNQQETKKDQEYTKKTPFDEFKEQFEKYKKFSDKFEEDDKKTTENNQKKTNDYQQKTTRNSTVTELEQQYYTRLSITPAATWEQIKASYKSEMKKYHPDKYANEPEKQKSAEAISQKINEAYHYFEKKFKK